jgi:hypothetical protein
MYLWILAPFILQTIMMTLDECYFHLPRGLPKWERIGHPLDTCSVLLCYIFVQFVPYSPILWKWFIGLALFSCLMITKDEFVHKHHCKASEHWVHAILFVNHPILLFSLGLCWPILHQVDIPSWIPSWMNEPEVLSFILSMEGLMIASFLIYQVIYWNFLWKEEKAA